MECRLKVQENRRRRSGNF